MSLENAVVVAEDGSPLYWHSPVGRSAVHLPESDELFWVGMWPHRFNLAGLAHSHPGKGEPVPSWEDVTTFSAKEQAFGRLTWWICTEDTVRAFRWAGPGKYDYRVCEEQDPEMVAQWLPKLREISYFEGESKCTD